VNLTSQPTTTTLNARRSFGDSTPVVVEYTLVDENGNMLTAGPTGVTLVDNNGDTLVNEGGDTLVLSGATLGVYITDNLPVLITLATDTLMHSEA
jgi:hypothetical protein